MNCIQSHSWGPKKVYHHHHHHYYCYYFYYSSSASVSVPAWLQTRPGEQRTPRVTQCEASSIEPWMDVSAVQTWSQSHGYRVAHLVTLKKKHSDSTGNQTSPPYCINAPPSLPPSLPELYYRKNCIQMFR